MIVRSLEEIKREGGTHAVYAGESVSEPGAADAILQLYAMGITQIAKARKEDSDREHGSGEGNLVICNAAGQVILRLDTRGDLQEFRRRIMEKSAELKLTAAAESPPIKEAVSANP